MRFAIVAFGCVLLAGISAAQGAPPSTKSLSTVSGQVVQEPGGMPLRKVLVSLTGTHGGGDSDGPSVAVTDAEGHFQIDGVRPGDYQVTLERNGFVTTSRRSRAYSAASLSVTAGQEITSLLFRMLPAGVIQGKILDEDGDPVPDVNVVAATSTGRDRFVSGTTNDLGEYRIGGLAAGEYLVLAATTREPVTVGAKPDEPRVYAPTFYPGTMENHQATKVEVHPGDEANASFSLISTRTFTVRGRVSGVAFSRPPGTAPSLSNMVHLQPASGLTGRELVGGPIRPDGTFEISGVLPGSYRAGITAQNAGSWQDIPTSQAVEVRDADVDGIQLSPQPPSQIRGRFRMDTNIGQNPDWTQVNIQIDPDDHDGSNGQIVGKVAKDGSFNIEAPAGNYHVIVTSNSNGESWRDFIVKEVVLNGKDVGDLGFALVGGLTSLEIVASAQGSTIEGNVVDEDGKPVADVPVVCIPDAGRRMRHDIYQQVTTDSQGHFTMRGLNPGEYRVFTLDDPADDITQPDFVRAHEALGQTVTLEPGERKGVVLKLPAESHP